MGLHGALGDAQARGNLEVVRAGRHELQHLALALGEPLQRGGWSARVQAHQLRGNEALPARHLLDGGHQRRAARVELAQVAGRSRLEAALQQGGFAVGGEHDRTGVGKPDRSL